MMGGSESIDFLAPSGVGREHARHLRERRLRRRPRGRARDSARARVPADARRAGGDRDAGRHDDARRSPSSSAIDAAATSKAMPVTKDDGTVVLALVRGDDRLEAAKLDRGARRGRRARRPTRRSAPRSAPSPARSGRSASRARSSPTRRCARASSSPARTATGWHLRGVEAGRDFEARFADLRVPAEGDRCPDCGGALRFQTAIEVGHIFKLGTRYSVPLGATFLDEDGQEKPLVMGSYGIGPGRVHGGGRRAAPRRATGSAGRRRSRRTTCTSSCCPGAEEIGERGRASALRRPGATCCSTIATCAPGEKFADADLIGIPIRVTVGQEEPRGRRGRRARSRDRRGAACERWPIWARRS